MLQQMLWILKNEDKAGTQQSLDDLLLDVAGHLYSLGRITLSRNQLLMVRVDAEMIQVPFPLTIPEAKRMGEMDQRPEVDFTDELCAPKNTKAKKGKGKSKTGRLAADPIMKLSSNISCQL